ncbi:MAG: hypothetical protein ABIU09_05930 [Pyrinomonadaceae bacterium]
MKRSLMIFSCAAILLAGSASIAVAQDTKTTTVVTKKEVVVNSDGTYTVIEYPVGKEVMVNLLPGATLAGSKGMARIVRAADGTKVYVDVSGVPATTTNYYAYAVDPSGVATTLGPVTFKDGVATSEFMTPLNQFMVVLSPTEGLTTIDPKTVVFQSELPAGYTVVPRRTAEVKAVTVTRATNLKGDKQVAIAETVSSTYDVPLLNVPGFNNKSTEIRINFSGDLEGLKGKAYIDPGQKGTTQIKMRFDDMKMAPKDKRFVLWASAADGSYTKLGQVINTGKRQESEIRSETALTDFGLFVTMEDVDVTTPTSKVYSVFGRNP